MIISCKCLNVIINCNGTLIDLEIASLNLSPEEQNDSFFKERVGTVELGRISKAQPILVQVKNVGNWIIHFCMNCSMKTHAIHQTKGAAFVLVSKALLTDRTEIEALKSSVAYSRVFNVIVYHRDNALTPTKLTAPQFSGPLQASLSALQQQLTEKVQQEVARTEEKVEQQYRLLEEFREHAHSDYRSLTRVLLDAQENINLRQHNGSELLGSPPHATTSSSSPMPVLASPMASLQRSGAACQNNTGVIVKQLPSSYQQSPGSPMQLSRPNVSPGGVKAGKRVPSRLFSRSTNPTSYSGSLDTEGLFDLEGMEENRVETFHSEEETDTDDSGSHDEGIHIPRGRSGSYAHNIAKSLPVTVPAYHPSYASHVAGDSDDERAPQDPVDIAASIKALARSVHGDTNVFGDLPRPRRSMNL